MRLLVDHVKLHPFLTVAPPPDPGRWDADDAIVDGAIWIDRGVVAAVGPRDRVLACASPGAAKVDGRGALAVPGFVDSHLHLARWALARIRPDVGGFRSADQVLAVLRAAASAMPAGTWLVAHGLDPELFEPVPQPPATLLESIDPGRPIAVYSRDLHSVFLSRTALLLVGAGADRPPPDHGVIERDPEGRPTGILREQAVGWVEEATARVPPGQLAALVEAAQPELWRAGVVGLHAPEDALALGALGLLREQGRLGVRVWFMPPASMLPHLEATGLRQGFGDAWLKLGPLKAFADGSLTSRTAALLEPYCHVPDDTDTGRLLMDAQAVAELVRRAGEAGFSVAVHAIGDRACREVLGGLEQAGVPFRPERPHRIEHVQLITPEDAARLARLGVVASVQPVHAPSDRPTAERYWKGRTHRAYAYRMLRDAGAALAFGSDAPVEAFEPLKGIYAAVTRQAPPGLARGGEAGPWHPEQGLTVVEALLAYTWGSAVAVGEHKARGLLAAGMAGDVVLLSEDILQGPPQALLQARVMATIVGGRLVWGEVPVRSGSADRPAPDEEGAG